MKKLVMAALLATAALAGPPESAGAMQLLTPPLQVEQHQHAPAAPATRQFNWRRPAIRLCAS